MTIHLFSGRLGLLSEQVGVRVRACELMKPPPLEQCHHLSHGPIRFPAVTGPTETLRVLGGVCPTL